MGQKQVKFSELPEFIRIKLSEPGKKEFWHRLDEFGGIKNFCEAFDYSSSTVYNWKNKDGFIPVEVVKSVFGTEASDEVVAFKGEGRSKPVENPEFPIEVSEELLTRIECSVNVNSNGIPFYQVNDQGLVDRFAELLQEIGDVPFKVYNRSVYELRYPKYIHNIFSAIEFEKNFAAVVDEKGEIRDGYVRVEDREIPVAEFDRELYSRQKKYELYLARGDSEKLEEVISEEASRVGLLFKS